MAILRIRRAGEKGVVKDVGAHALPLGAWSDALNIRFQNGAALQFYGHSEVYNSPSEAPQHLLPVDVGSARYWVYMTATKAFAVTNSAGAAVHTDITHATPHAGVVNQWTMVNFGGVPIANVGDTSKVPMYWDLNTANNFVNVTNWTAGTYCKALRQFKNMLVALNITESGTAQPHALILSTPADPGALPDSWDYTDATKDALKLPVSEGQGVIKDGGQLREDFIVYKEASAHRLQYIGGAFIVDKKQIFGMSGILNTNCWTEFDGFHFVVTASDVVVHDGFTANSVLDNVARRDFFQSIDAAYIHLVHVCKNPFLNEISIHYPQIGSTVCDRALVYNYREKTVTYRELPNVNHAACGPVDNSLANTWAADADTWDSDTTAWNGPDYTPSTARVIMASSDSKLYLLDGSASFNGEIPDAYLERRGIGFDDDEHMKMIISIRLRVTGNAGETINISIGGHNTDPYAEPTYDETQEHVIGETIVCDFTTEYRYPAIKISSGSAYQWRLDNYDIEVEQMGMY
jgi:hypothetical protein